VCRQHIYVLIQDVHELRCMCMLCIACTTPRVALLCCTCCPNISSQQMSFLRLVQLTLIQLVMLSGFRLNTDSIHLETKDDGQGKLTGTGLAYVQFAHPAEAEQARQIKHKQMMGTRYIECMIFVPGHALQAHSHVLIPMHHLHHSR